MSQRERILHQLNLKASSYQTLEEDFKKKAVCLAPHPPAQNISGGTRIRIQQGQVNLQAGKG